MTLQSRRIVTGHDQNGKAIVESDERLEGKPRLGRVGISGCEIWSTDHMPIDHADAAAQRAGFVRRYNYVGTGQGSVIRVTQLEPNGARFMHRTETLDYAILLSGTCDLELDGGEVLHLGPGDIVIQRGTMHAWVNSGPGPCVFAFILLDATPALAGGETLTTHYPV